MSNRIQLLPEVVANQIAAGEVVNRPASVVKEMMENAVDAGATCVMVNFRDGGRDLIQIVDNGCGMSPVDARMAFDRHATSKIRSVDDIYKLRTFGFRGEALASIAAVAQVELRSRTADEELGTLTEINGGEFVSQKAVAAPVGSQFMVRNLFYNVPARRRFMEKSTVSATHIKTEFQRVALCNPQVRFDLYNNDAPVYHLEATTLPNRIVEVVGPAIRHNLLEVEADTSIVKIHGFVGRPEAAKKTKPDQYLFVNGRYFRSPYFQKALMRAYEKLIPEGSFPACFLYFEIDPERVDVNVHPQKTEVKFADEEAVWQILNAAVRETLGKTGAIPMMDFNDEGKVEIPVADRTAFYQEPPSRSDLNYNPFLEGYDAAEAPSEPRGVADVAALFNPPASRPIPSEFAVEEFASRGWEEEFASESNFDFVGSEQESATQASLPTSDVFDFGSALSLAGGYAVALCGGGLVAVDLRRARECILYEEYLALLQSGSAVSQQLLFPERLVLSEREYALLEENLVDFVALGFELELCGGGALEVKGIPADMLSEELDRLLYELLKLFETPASGVEVHRERLAATMAAAGARPLSTPLREEELRLLLERLAACRERSFTPRGKRVVCEISTQQLKEIFS